MDIDLRTKIKDTVMNWFKSKESEGVNIIKGKVKWNGSDKQLEVEIFHSLPKDGLEDIDDYWASSKGDKDRNSLRDAISAISDSIRIDGDYAWEVDTPEWGGLFGITDAMRKKMQKYPDCWLVSTELYITDLND